MDTKGKAQGAKFLGNRRRGITGLNFTNEQFPLMLIKAMMLIVSHQIVLLKATMATCQDKCQDVFEESDAETDALFLQAYKECAEDFSDEMEDHLLLQASHMYEDLLKTVPLKMSKWAALLLFQLPGLPNQ